MPVVDCEEISIVSEVLEHTAGILAFLLLGPRSHQTGDIHFDRLEGVALLLVFVSFVLLFLLFGLAGAEDAQKVHGNLNMISEDYNGVGCG